MAQTTDRNAHVTGQSRGLFSGETAQNPRRKASHGCHNTGIHHVGLHATDPATSAEFYRDVLGMEIVGGSAADHPLDATAFE